MDQAKATYKQDERRRIYQQIERGRSSRRRSTRRIYVAYSLEAMSAERAGVPAQSAGQARCSAGSGCRPSKGGPRGALPPPPAPGGGAAGDPRHVDGVLARSCCCRAIPRWRWSAWRTRARRSSRPSASGSASTARSSCSTLTGSAAWRAATSASRCAPASPSSRRSGTGRRSRSASRWRGRPSGSLVGIPLAVVAADRRGSIIDTWRAGSAPSASPSRTSCSARCSCWSWRCSSDGCPPRAT